MVQRFRILAVTFDWARNHWLRGYSKFLRYPIKPRNLKRRRKERGRLLLLMMFLVREIRLVAQALVNGRQRIRGRGNENTKKGRRVRGHRRKEKIRMWVRILMFNRPFFVLILLPSVSNKPSRTSWPVHPYSRRIQSIRTSTITFIMGYALHWCVLAPIIGSNSFSPFWFPAHRHESLPNWTAIDGASGSNACRNVHGTNVTPSTQ